jgi:FKBP-type peptidyl-prolyl cis-trans isomerase
MKKLFITVTSMAAVAMMLLANAWTQQAAPANPQSAPAAKAQHTTAAKPHSTTAASSQKPLVLKTQTEKISYALGINMGTNLHRQSVEVDPAIVMQGLKDGIAGTKPLLNEDEARALLTQLQEDMRAKMAAKAQQMGAANKAEGDAFLAANKTKPGVVALPSGLQYKILKAGTGPKPAATDSVVCNYRGTLINGKQFDASKLGAPVTFPVNGVIKGWTEAVQLMPVGSKWQLFIPPDLAYGDRGAGPDIGPNTTLVFDVELVSIQSKPQETKPQETKPQ